MQFFYNFAAYISFSNRQFIKRKHLYTMKQFTIGLDLGGTNSVFGIVDRNGNIVAETTIKTQGFANAEQYVDASMVALNKIIAQVGGIETISSMGIGAPNGNILSGCIEYAPNIAWAHEGMIPLARMFSERLNKISVKITNDANTAALGEMKYGAAKDMKDFIVLTLGTGVGSGIVCNGQLVVGCDGNAGELGHVIVERENGRQCGCGRRGCLETYCSATGVARTARQFLADTNEESVLRNKKAEEITSYDVAKAAEGGDVLAKKIFDYTGTIMGKACADMAAFSSPEAFIFFGGLSKAGRLLLDPIEKAYNENVMATFRGKAKFMLSAIEGAGASVLGAASIE